MAHESHESHESHKSRKSHDEPSCGCGSGGSCCRGGSGSGEFSRRSFLSRFGVGAAAAISAGAEARASKVLDKPSPSGTHADDAVIVGPDPVEIELSVNGEMRRLTVDPATTLLEAIRVSLNLTGSKEICDRGSCGGCSVIADGKLITSCMILALDAQGMSIQTVEGLTKADGTLDPVQEAFVRHDALQCGYCTPGLIMACRALLNENPKPSLDEIKRGLNGNICRCGTYTNIFNAALEASGQAPIIDQGSVNP